MARFPELTLQHQQRPQVLPCTGLRAVAPWEEPSLADRRWLRHGGMPSGAPLQAGRGSRRLDQRLLAAEKMQRWCARAAAD
ncbi:hypothetical protein [Mumia zhuanghuii]|uniref:Uncharacterized protein n=1 Tax=Mumia zhuanghuii TaxID=2585211 RepID=A0A5C4MIJ5_9ACTN|nr:hypothetical protein [Mumia zhuanghuii]TNC41846.1 hypothetical protein FHE65_21700 [Mumia zhuanghuii]